MRSKVFTCINWPYVIFCAVVGTAGLAFIAWAITMQVYREWLQGLPLSGGWSWPIVIVVDIVCTLLIGALYWKIYYDLKTTIDDKGVFQPSLFGIQNIRWPEVTKVEVFGGVGYHIYAGDKKIVVTPYAYKEPEQVIETLRVNITAANGGVT